jgi:eukaryotic-like serine/threonine-protein kinase
MREDSHDAFEFGAFRFTVNDRQLTRDVSPVHLTPKAADLLLVLLENAGRVVSKEALLE